MLRLPTGKNLAATVLLALLVVVHLVVVVSILDDGRPLIWPLHNDTVHRLGPAADFYAVYHAGVATGRGDNPYSDSDDGVTPYSYPFRYLPAVGFLARPLTLLSPRQAFTVWVILLESLLAVLLVVLWRRIPGWWVRRVAVGLLLVSSPYFLELYMGQFTFASVTLCCLAVLMPLGVVWYALAVLLKPLVLAAAPALLRQRRNLWQVVGAITLMLLSSVPYFVHYPDRWEMFFQVNFVLGGGLEGGNHSLVRLMNLLAVDLHLEFLLTYWDAAVALSRYSILAGTALLVLMSRRQAVVTGVAALLLAHFVTYQHVWEHHMSAVAVLAAVLLTVPGWPRRQTGVILGALLLLAVPTPFVWLDVAKDPEVWDPAATWPRWGSYVVALAKVVPTVALFMVTVVDLVRGGVRSPRETVTDWQRAERSLTVDGR